MSRHSGTTLRPDQGPWHASQCDAYYFLLDADRNALQQTVDRALNSITGAQRFRVTVAAVALTFQQFSNMYIRPAGAESPVLNYPEAAFFVMVSDQTDADRTYIWTPFMYCGNVLATVSGREVFGFPKEFSEIHLDGKAFSVNGLGLAVPGAGEPPGYEPMTIPIVSGGVHSDIFELADAAVFRQLNLDKLRQDKHLEAVSDVWEMFGGVASTIGRWIDLLVDPSINFILDRSRFAANTGRWHSELLRARSPVNQLTLKRFLPPLSFTITSAPSHPIVTQLGLITNAGHAGRVTPLMGCKLELDFSLDPPVPLQ